MQTITVDDFYKHASQNTQESVDSLLPSGINKEIGHFNVFSLVDLMPRLRADPGHIIRSAWYGAGMLPSMPIRLFILKRTPYCLQRQKYLITGSRRTLTSRAISAYLPVIF